jgi:hypothetical protein
LMLDIKEPDGDRGAHDHHGSLHEECVDESSRRFAEATPARDLSLGDLAT